MKANFKQIQKISSFLNQSYLISLKNFSSQIQSYNFSSNNQSQKKNQISININQNIDNVCKFKIPEKLDHLSDSLKEKIQTIQQKNQFIPNIFLALSKRPAELSAYFEYHDALMLSQNSSLTKAEKEMLFVAISGINQCSYCSTAHGAILRILSKNSTMPEQVQINYKTSTQISEKQKAMLEFALKIANDIQNLKDSDYENLKKHGFNDDDIWDIGCISSFISMSNRLMSFLNVQPNKEFYFMGRNFSENIDKQQSKEKIKK